MSNVLALRALKGAPLSCLIALSMSGRPVGVTWLSTATGFEKKAVIAGLRVLESLSLAASSARYNGWQLTDEARELPLMLSTGKAVEEQRRGGAEEDTHCATQWCTCCEPSGCRGAEERETDLERVSADSDSAACERQRRGGGGAKSAPGRGGGRSTMNGAGGVEGEVRDRDLGAGGNGSGGPFAALPPGGSSSLNNSY